MRVTTGRIWEVAATDESRPVLTCVYFDAKNGTLAATDSYIAARVPCDVDEGDESGLIPAEAVETAGGRSLLVRDGKATLSFGDGERTWNLVEGTFPDLDEVFTNGAPAKVIVGLNADFLARLSKGLGGRGVARLSASHPRKAILVGAPPADVQGAIMPVVLADDATPSVPDLWDDDRVIAAARAAVALLDKRRGKKRAAQAFRDVLTKDAN